MSRVNEFLERIRELDGLKHAIIGEISVYKRNRTAEFTLITDKTYSTLEEAQALEICQEFLPDGFSARVKVVKRVPDAEGLQRRIYEYIKKYFPGAGAFLTLEAVEVEMLVSGAHFYVDIASGDKPMFSSGKILDEVSAYLSTVFCGTFYGNVRIVERELPEDDFNDYEEKEEEVQAEIRRFTIENYQKIDGFDGEMPSVAVYMADSSVVDGTFHICGTVNYIEEIEYVRKNDKGEESKRTRFSVTVTDGTTNIRTTYFPKKATVEKVREIKVGDKIIITGTNEEYNGSKSFKASKLNFGTPPEGFVPVERKGKPVPKAYHTVFPEAYVDYAQAGFFDDLSKPDDLKNNVFVCFDLETTGLNNNPAMGKMDKIIELGAVKIVDGAIKEKFSTFVACSERLSREIIDLTGIQDADLVGAPEVDKVMADFFKFTDGAYLVGHNVTFDYRFVKYYGEKNGYMFDKKQYDTLTLAQDVLRGQLANYKLNTVADYYGLTFNHHRAFDDALVTAKVFIELVKKRGALPKV